MIEAVLSEIGMTGNEIKVYLALLKSGQLSVNEIGQKSGLHRQVCYDALERLMEKDFVSYVAENNKKLFKALEPEKLVDYLDTKKELVNAAMPELKKLAKMPKEETDVEVIRSRNVLRKILKDTVETLKKEGGELLAIGIDETKIAEEDKIAIAQYLQNMKKCKLHERLIASKGARLYYKGGQSEYRLVGPEYFNPNPIYIYWGKVVFVIWGSPTYAVIIKSRQVFDSNRKYFEMLWKVAKPLKA